MHTPELNDLFTLLRFPSVSTDSRHNADTRAAAEWLVQKLTGIGFATSLHETPGHPVVIAKNKHVAGRRTVLLYGHYDVQPAEPLAEWKTKPFEPTIVGDRIMCRGATDNKGQLMAHVCGLEKTMREHGELPVNLTCLFEGEEEIGSPNLKPFLEANKDMLKCDVVAISDTGMVAPGVGTFTYGLRGIACCEVIAHGPSTDLHSGIWGGSVANPATAIARLIASLHDDHGRIRVEGFYDGVRPFADWEREQWKRLGDTAAEVRAVTGVTELFGESGYTDLERRWGRPTAEVNGIGGGFQGQGTKTVIPRTAFAKLSFRLPADLQPLEIQAKVDDHLKMHTPPGIKIDTTWENFGAPFLMDPFSRFGMAAQHALRKTFGTEPALIREGASIPVVQTFRDIFHVDTLLLGLGLPDCQAHAPNENFPIENFRLGIQLNQDLLVELSI